MWAERTIVEC